MALCGLMIGDFMRGGGRYGESGELLYSNYDLRMGISYTEWCLELGYEKEPFYKFDLEKFIEWAQDKLQRKEVADDAGRFLTIKHKHSRRNTLSNFRRFHENRRCN